MAAPLLPVEHAIPALRDALLASGAAILQAPPGAGKTTRIPLALLNEPWMTGMRMIMLEPRRLATRAAATYMAKQLGEVAGAAVGYRTRLDSRMGPRTRIEVVTEGVLTRMLQDDPTLDGVALVIFDEFHERNLVADLGLALTLRTRELLRPDLRLLVMSATLDAEPVAALLGDAPVIASAGRSFPVDTRYIARRDDQRVEGAVTAAIRRALVDETGDLLVFLPGEGEIRRVEDALRERSLPHDVDLYPLYGMLSPEMQDRAIAPSPAGRRKIVLATSIAETSLTIDGVRVVIDSGLSRVARYSSGSGMRRLETVRVSRASADQRRGRAGRTAPGVCYRLWDEAELGHLLPARSPEIMQADLAPLALDLAACGVTDPAELRWLDAPPATAYAVARELLAELGAIDAGGQLTVHGRHIAALGTHPRLGHLLLAGHERGFGALACDVAAMLDERDPFRSTPGDVADVDIRLRLEALHDTRPADGARVTVDRGALHRIRERSRQLGKRLHIDGDVPAGHEAGAALALAYPDRVAQRRPGKEPRYLMRNGRGAVLAGAQSLGMEPFLVIADLDDRKPESRVFLAAPITRDEVDELFALDITDTLSVTFDPATGRVSATSRRMLGAIALDESRVARPSHDVAVAAILDGVRRFGLGTLPWTDHARRTRDRVAFLHRMDAGAWPDVSDEGLLSSLDDWLAPCLTNHPATLASADIASARLDRVPPAARRQLDALAPTHLEVPTGSRIAVDYSDPASPVLAVRLQEVFGLTETPRVGGGRVAVTMHLLSPAHRPVQVTRDLAGFWTTSYFDVRKDLRGRYPKHEWPEDPMSATPTKRVKRR